MILTRSPYYKYIPWRRPSDNQIVSSYTLELFVWEGDSVSDKPSTPTYERTKQNVEALDNDDKVNIAVLIDDFIENNVIEANNTSLNDANAAVWVSTQVKYNVGGDITTELISTDYATRGFAFGYEVENYEPTSNLLTDTTEIDVDKTSLIHLPYFRESLVQGDTLTIISYPNNNLNNTYTPTYTGQSSEVIGIVTIDCNDAGDDLYIEVTYKGDIVRYYLRDECINVVHNVQYVNRYGASQSITFFGKRTDTLNVNRETYERAYGRANLGDHQFKDFNTNGQTSFDLFTGYLYDTQNPMFKDLALSESVWLDGLPVNVTLSSVQYKTRRNDKLASYTFNFKYSYNEISTN